MKTYVAKKGEIERKWYVIDAAGKSIGRISARIAHILQGKHKPIYTPHVDTGDFVVVVNAEKIAATKKKLEQKLYHHYTGYIGGLRTVTLGKQLEKCPEDVIRHAVKGMVPKTKLGRQMLTKLKVYAGQDHPHEAQQPELLEL